MSYALSFDEPAAEAVERVRREQLEKAAEALEHGDDPVEAVHDARKRLKKTRSLLRLARPKRFGKRNRALRDAGRSLAGARDADVLVETLDSLGGSEAARAPLVARTGDTPEPGESVATLRALADDEWSLRKLGPRAFEKSLKSTYRRGRKAFKTADEDPTAEHLHEWRKRVKDLWYQQRLLEEAWPGVMKAQAKQAKKLSKLLGTDHDLAVLADALVNDPELRSAPDREALLERIADRREQLLEDALALGRRIYAERPKAFAKRMRRYVAA